jgi:indolepyruvate ferredoxin oxidoreductase beta subunit
VKADVVLAGVGGQGVLTVAAILAEAARRDGLTVKQSEVHGMSQRGGAVVAGLRISDGVIHSVLIPEGCADALVGLEPVEALRYVSMLRRGGVLLTAGDPLEDIPDYPDLEEIHRAVGEIPGAVVIDAAALAKEAGSPRSSNVVMAGAASVLLPMGPDNVAACVAEFFSGKGERVVECNRRAFVSGRTAVEAVG